MLTTRRSRYSHPSDRDPSLGTPVLAPGTGKTKTGRLWTYVRDDRPSGDLTAPAVWFAYSPDRKGEHPKQHLQHYKGALQSDAYAGFHHLYESGAIYEVACRVGEGVATLTPHRSGRAVFPCSASTILSHGRQLFLPMHDNYRH
jgi:hypothetical protein